jgi:hypothetical protein
MLNILDPIPRKVLRLAAFLLAIGCAGAVQAQQVPGLDDDEDEPEAAGMVQQQNVFMMDDSNFDMWVFGGNRNGAQGRKRLDDLLSLQIELLDRECKLDEAQKKKLLLAGRGDAKRFYDRVDVLRRKFQKVKNDQNKIGEIYQEIQPLQLVLNAGPFGEGSIFAKTLPRALKPEQVTKYEEIDRERRRFRYGAKVDGFIARLDNSLGLTDEQRRKIRKVVLDETLPPRSFGQQDQQVVTLQVSKIPEAKLRPIFDEAQWKIVSRQLAQVKGLEFHLKSMGYVPGNAPAGVDAKAPADAKATSIPLRGR